MCRADLITLRSNTGEQTTIPLNNKVQLRGQHVTVGELRQRAAEVFPKSGYKASDVRLIVADKQLNDDSVPLCHCGIESGSVVQMVCKVHGG